MELEIHRNSLMSSGNAVFKVGIESICELQEQVTLTPMPSSSAILLTLSTATISKRPPYKPLMEWVENRAKQKLDPEN